MSSNAKFKRLDALIRKYLQVPKEMLLEDKTTISSLGPPAWRVVDLAIAVESEFGISLDADSALAMKTVGAWRDIVENAADARGVD